MKKAFAKLKMNQKIMLVSVMGILLTAIILGTVFFKVTEKMFVEKVSNITKEAIVQNTKYINNELSHILQLVHSNLIGYDVSSLVLKYNENGKTSVTLNFQIQQMLTQLSIQNEFIHSAYLVDGDNVVCNLNQVVEYDLDPVLEKARSQRLAYWSDEIIYTDKKQMPLLPLVISVPLKQSSEYYPFDTTPKLIINISYNKINKVLKELEKQVFGKVHLLNSQGKAFEDLELQTNHQYLVQENIINISEWHIGCLQDKKLLYADFYDSQVTVFLSIAILIALFSLVSRYLSKTITRPLQKLTLYAKELEQQHYNQRINIFGKDEIAELGQAFNSLSEEMQRYTEVVEEDKRLIRQEEMAKRRIELELLQAQLNPHFLYNTLDSLYWYSVTNKNNQMGEIILNLSKLLRIGLNKGSQEVPLEIEVEHVRSYLIIQKDIFGDKFTYEILFDESLGKHHVVKILLQPLVENSILHGFADIEKGGKIIVRVFEKDDFIILQVEDNGCGFSKEKLVDHPEQRHSGFALNNVKERLVLNYSEAATLIWESEPYVSTKVSIFIPVDKLL